MLKRVTIKTIVMGSEKKKQINSSIEHTSRERWVIVSDLDGSLLDHHTYSHEAATPALAQLRRLNLPLVLNTSKTIKETITIASRLGIGSPIVVENGGGIFLTHRGSERNYWVNKNQHLDVSEWIPNGITRNKILLLLKKLKEEKRLKFTSFTEMSLAELASCTGLSEASARAAKNRDFSEPLVWKDTPEQLDWFRSRLAKANLHIVKGGRFYSVTGKHDKSSCFEWIRNYFKTEDHPNVRIVALGDGLNDLPMLEASDKAICIRSPVNPPLSSNKQTIVTTEKIGVPGWNDSVITTLNQLQLNQPKPFKELETN